MENTAEANTVLEDLVDVENCVIGLLRSTICHVVYVQYHFRHLLLPLPASTSPEPRPDCLPSHFLPLCGIRIRNPLSQYLAPEPFLFPSSLSQSLFSRYLDFRCQFSNVSISVNLFQDDLFSFKFT